MPRDYQAAQASLSAALARELGKVWPLLDVKDLKGSLPDFIAVVAALVNQYSLAAGTVAADFYDAQRAAAEVTAPFTVVPTGAPSLGRVESAVRWATKTLWAPDPVVEPAQDLVVGVSQTMVADTARDTVITNTRRDPKAKGWARIPEPTACSFCMLLATRGAVYSQETVRFRAHEPYLKNGKRVGGVCQCHAEPVFHVYEPSAAIRSAQGLYEQAKRAGSGVQVRRAFRRLYEAQQMS